MTPSLFAVAALALSVQQHPSAPAVGDLITLRFPVGGGQELAPHPPAECDVIRSAGRELVVRCFKPGEVAFPVDVLRGETSERHLVPITIRSVLAADDSLDPAPLKPPVQPAANLIARNALIGAAVAAAVSWLAVALLLRRKRHRGQALLTTPADALLATLRQLRSLPREVQPIVLADAIRQFLASIRGGLGRHWTSAELAARLQHEITDTDLHRLIIEALRAGDQAKFSREKKIEDVAPLTERAARLADIGKRVNG